MYEPLPLPPAVPALPLSTCACALCKAGWTQNAPGALGNCTQCTNPPPDLCLEYQSTGGLGTCTCAKCPAGLDGDACATPCNRPECADLADGRGCPCATCSPGFTNAPACGACDAIPHSTGYVVSDSSGFGSRTNQGCEAGWELNTATNQCDVCNKAECATYAAGCACDTCAIGFDGAPTCAACTTPDSSVCLEYAASGSLGTCTCSKCVAGLDGDDCGTTSTRPSAPLMPRGPAASARRAPTPGLASSRRPPACPLCEQTPDVQLLRQEATT
ncbi:hypothetical protein ABPG75_001437 [Micractinium tetrahymenae]